MGEIPESSEERFPQTMDCPFCGGRMARGTSGLESLWLNFLQELQGSDIGLFFRQRGSKRIGVFGFGYERDTFYCDGCGTITVAGMRAKAAECPTCNHTIPPGISLCRECGKTYDPASLPVEY